jgi:hypothetical protein
VTSPILWACIAVVALIGWTAVLVLLSRALLPMANALVALHKVDALIDDRIAKLWTRVQQRQERTTPPPPRREQEQTGGNSAADALRDIFGSSPLLPVSEQPDADDLEIVS